MKFEMNARMKKFLKKNNISPENYYSLIDELKLITNPGVENYQDCVLLKSQMQAVKTTSIQDCLDKTGFECFINHIHLDSFVFIKNKVEIISQALAFSQEVSKIVKKISQSDNFKIIIGMDGFDCSVRFHKVRIGESWLSSNLDGYDEAVISIET